MHPSATRQGPSARRPQAVTILAILAVIGAIGAALGALAGALLVHGLDSLDAADAVRVLPGLVLAALYLAFAHGAWTLKPWGWTLGLVVGLGTIAYLTAILAVEWTELMRDAPPLAWMSLLIIVVAGVGLVYWLRPEIRAAFDRD